MRLAERSRRRIECNDGVVTELSPSKLRALALRVSSFAATLEPQEREFLGTLLAMAEHAKLEAEQERIDAGQREAAEKANAAIDEALGELVTGVSHSSSDDWPPRLRTSVSATIPDVGLAAVVRPDATSEPVGEFLRVLRSLKPSP